MVLAKEIRAHDCEPYCLESRCSVAVPRQRKLLPSIFTAIVAGGCAVVLCGAPSWAQAPAKDLWQTYMEAALGSNQTEDFKIEAITLNAALAYTKQHDADGQRPVLTRLPLMLAYGELGRDDLLKPLAEQGMHIDVSNLHKLLDDYVSTVDNYASSYYNRWVEHMNDKSIDAFKQEVRYYGAKNSYLIEVALRTKLRPDDEVGLATTISQVGLTYKKNNNFDCAGYDYGRAFQIFQDFQRKRDGMMITADHFSASNPGTPQAEQGATGQAFIDTEAYLVLAMASSMIELAYRSLHSPSDNASSAAKTDLAAACDNFGPPARTPPAVGFDALVKRDTEYFDALANLTSELHEYSPKHPFFGVVDYWRAELYDVEYQVTSDHPDQYPDSLPNARAAFEESLDIMTHAHGPNSDFVRGDAREYVDLLIKAKLPDEAKRIEDRYGVTPSN